MSRFSWRNFPFITISLIVINSLVFLFSSGFTDFETGKSDVCIIKNAPQCVKFYGESTNREMIDCFLKFKPLGSNAYVDQEVLQLCTFKYDILADCALENAKDCFSQQDLFYYKFGFVPAIVAGGKQLYSFITSLFIHGNFEHIFLNMLYLFLFGTAVEWNMGKKRFFILYIICGLLASLAELLIYPGRQSPSIGASGAIMGAAGAVFLIYSIKGRTFNMGDVPVLNKIFRSRIYFSVAFFIILIIQQLIYLLLGAQGIGYVAHLGGFFSGLLIAYFLERKVTVKDYVN